VVFGDGTLDAKIVFVGEGPGQEEDRQGLPFVGAAGKLLTQLIGQLGLKREMVYIANVVKCRPPNNRPPEPDEIAACFPYLKAQLTTIHPQVICALGRTAANTLLGKQSSMGELRAKTYEWEGTPLVVTFHPAYLLRNPSAMPLIQQDMKQLLKFVRME
jgi:DNA polymerase